MNWLNTDKVTTWLGFLGGLVTALQTYSAPAGTSGKTIVLGYAAAALMWVFGYFTNKTTPKP